MKRSFDEHKEGIFIRIIATLSLVILAFIIWVFTNPANIFISKEWISSVTSGLVVLGIAGIWVSFFAERQAAKSIKNDIDTRFSIVSSALNARIYNIYYDEGPLVSNRDNYNFQSRLIYEIDRAQGEISIFAIAGREFFHEGRVMLQSELEISSTSVSIIT